MVGEVVGACGASLGGPCGAAKAHCCVAVDESRSSLAARCVSFYQIVCLSLSLTLPRVLRARDVLCANPSLVQMCEPASEFELIQPDDFHHHLRDGPALATTVPAAARQFQRAIIMPNLSPPVTTTEMAQAYKQRILDALHASGAPAGSFDPMMTIYLTDTTTPEEIKRAAASGDIKAVKPYQRVESVALGAQQPPLPGRHGWLCVLLCTQVAH